MAHWRSVFAVSILLPGLAAAVDPGMWELVMPDARAVMEIQVDRIAGSQIGQAIAAQLKAKAATIPSSGLPALGALGQLDWSRIVQEVVVASGPNRPGQAPSALIIARGSLDPAWLDSIPADSGGKSTYMGVPIVTYNKGTQAGAVAILDNSLAVAGQIEDVKAAIQRRGDPGRRSPMLADGLARFEGHYDLWVISSGPLNIPAKSSPSPATEWLKRMDGFTCAARFSPDFELNLDLTMRTEKDMAELAKGVNMIAGMMRQKAPNLQDVHFKIEGKQLSLALHVPEPQLRAALQQFQASQMMQSARAAGAPVAPRPIVRPPTVISGLPAPAAGTIRVQSSASDMGNVVVQVDHQ